MISCEMSVVTVDEVWIRKDEICSDGWLKYHRPQLKPLQYHMTTSSVHFHHVQSALGYTSCVNLTANVSRK